MPIKNIRDLRKELCSVFETLKDDPRRVDQAKELSNAAGKIIGTCKVELEYAGMRKEKPNVDFLA